MNKMMQLEIFGGPEDGKMIEVSTDTVQQGYLRKPVFKPAAFTEATELTAPIEHEKWVIRKHYFPETKTFKVKLIEEGMWKRLQS